MNHGGSCRAGPELAARRARSDHEVGAAHCITCADEGVPMTVVALDATLGLALCTDGTQESAVETALVDSVAVGDRLLIHAGTAIASLNPSGSTA